MNLATSRRAASRFVHSLMLQARTYLPRQQCRAFATASSTTSGIGPIYVINLDRATGRWEHMRRELGCVVDATRVPLTKRVVRYSACDAQSDDPSFLAGAEIEPFYTLGDQLFVEPQPDALPDTFDLELPIRMSRAEVAVARSHIGVWKTVAQSCDSYALVLEDDVWFERGFARTIDRAWREMENADQAAPTFDVLYTSYREVRHGAPKALLSDTVFRPERGLWCLSGYVLSKKGAQALLGLLPCQGPIDLWINLKFKSLDVRALRRSVVNQRIDTPSTNSYSILPTLSRIGILDYHDSALFNQRPGHSPVFAFGSPNSGLSSLAMALSMLGYRCCSDLDDIPQREFASLMAGRTDRVFNAYVNIGSLASHAHVLKQRYPLAKFVILDDADGTFSLANPKLVDALFDADVAHFRGENGCAWRSLCEHLRLPPPPTAYPRVRDSGQKLLQRAKADAPTMRSAKALRHDPSPWVVERRVDWEGVRVVLAEHPETHHAAVQFEDELVDLQPTRWLSRNDTFPGNLGLFRSSNVVSQSGGGLSLVVAPEPLRVRMLSAAAISSQDQFLYGRFEATLRAAGVSGLVTGFFLHRDSPRQEIDVEITGNDPTRLLVNVFYNPGTEGAKFDYGYRGTPASIQLGFDASKSLHRYAIEWDPYEIRWFVDDDLVHRRATWNPTPIPHLPMTLHMNTWPTRSRELAGRLALRALPASTVVRRIAVNAWSA